MQQLGTELHFPLEQPACLTWANLIAMWYFPWLVIQTVTVSVHMYCMEHIQISRLIQLWAPKETFWKPNNMLTLISFFKLWSLVNLPIGNWLSYKSWCWLRFLSVSLYFCPHTWIIPGDGTIVFYCFSLDISTGFTGGHTSLFPVLPYESCICRKFYINLCSCPQHCQD